MANVQPQFEAFDDAVRLRRFDENATLRDKRDILRGRVDDNLAAVFERYGENVPEWSWRNQGSYELGTGVKPLGGAEIDIDQGLYFDVDVRDWDPVALKARVHEVLDGHTKRVAIRRPCVTVWYHWAGEPVFHVDIAVYALGSSWSKSRIAMGKENSGDAYRTWDVSDPQGLIDALYRRFPSGSRRDQFRRVVRTLKRWKDVNFSDAGNEAPLGVALTACAYHGLQNRATDPFAVSFEDPDDRAALLDLVDWIRGQIRPAFDAERGCASRTLSVSLPTDPYNDLFDRMTYRQTEKLEAKLDALRCALVDADALVDPVEACRALRSVLGDDFPVPAQQDTARATRPAFSRSGSSA